MAKISIIVPVYNVEKYLHKCINSILSQTLADFELILVDDGSKDSSGEICKEYAKKDSRIIVIHKENGGLSSARNAGIKIAKSDYLGFVDSDDWIDSNMYEYLYNGIIDNNADVALCRIFYQFENKTSYYYNDKFSDENKVLDGDQLLRFLLIKKIDGSCCTKLFKANIFENNCFLFGRTNEDFKFLYEVFPKMKKGIYINDVAYNYIIRNDSITSSINSSYIFDSYDNAKEMLDFIKIHKPDLIMEAESFYFMRIYGILRSLLKNNLIITHNDKYKFLKLNLLKSLNKILSNKYISTKFKLLIVIIAFFPKTENRLIKILK
jgi:glycosyltransferase involved in cell wall biosynthesis